MSTDTQLAPYDAFKQQIEQRASELLNILPPHLPVDRFQATAMIAIKDNPALLYVDRRSLHQAITEAAEDGLHPDGREATITIYKEKRKRRNENGAMIEEWVEVAQYNPMLYGIRKRAREVCGMIIDADIVYEKDTFRRRGGDDPYLEHEPPMLGQDRGKPVGAYAIFRQGSEILHREVMDAGQIEDVRQQSRNKDGLMWKKFWSEAWKKTVVRRGNKTVPAVPEFEKIIKRIDRDFPQFDRKAPELQTEPAKALQAETAPRAIAQDPPHDEDGVIIDEIAEEIADEGAQIDQGSPQTADNGVRGASASPKSEGPLAAYEAACRAADTTEALNSVWAMFEKKIPIPMHEAAVGVFEREFQRISEGR